LELDLKIIKTPTEYLVYGHDLNNIYKFSIENPSETIILKKKITNKDISGWEHFVGNNLTPIDILNNDTEIKLSFIDWFYENGVKIKINIYNKTTNEYKYEEKLIEPKEGYIGIKGAGDCDTGIPSFSLSTPIICIEDTDEKKVYLGVGHLKIKNPAHKCQYLSNEKLQIFRYNLHLKMISKYSDKYKIHLGSYSSSNYRDDLGDNCNGYIYMMYFYKLTWNKQTDTYEMKISDAFLPHNNEDSNKDRYKFSLFFPAGLVIENDQVIVSGGEGDYYSVILEFDKNKVLDTIIHDVSEFNISNYQYYLLDYRGPSESLIDDSLMIDPDNKLEQTGGSSNENSNKYKLNKYTHKIKNSTDPMKKFLYELKYYYYLDKSLEKK
jgi:hypothetical protein